MDDPPLPPGPGAPSDEERAKQAAQWFNHEVHPHGQQLKSYLRNSFPAVRDVEDVVQESYVRVWRRHLTQPITSAKAFLFQVARRLALDTIRHDRRSPIDVVTDLSTLGVSVDGPGPSDTACTNEEIELLLTAIESLPGRCREVFVLRKLEGLPQKGIAERLGISEQTVEVQIGRATRRCEQFLRDCGVIRDQP